MPWARAGSGSAGLTLPLTFSSRGSITETIPSIFRRSWAAALPRAFRPGTIPARATPAKSSPKGMPMPWGVMPNQRLSRVLARHRYARAASPPVIGGEPPIASRCDCAEMATCVSRAACLRPGWRFFLEVRRKLFDDELLEEAGDAAFRDSDQCALNQQARASIAGGIVGICDAAGDKRPDDC